MDLGCIERDQRLVLVSNFHPLSRSLKAFGMVQGDYGGMFGRGLKRELVGLERRKVGVER